MLNLTVVSNSCPRFCSEVIWRHPPKAWTIASAVLRPTPIPFYSFFYWLAPFIWKENVLNDRSLIFSMSKDSLPKFVIVVTNILSRLINPAVSAGASTSCVVMFTFSPFSENLIAFWQMWNKALLYSSQSVKIGVCSVSVL